MIDWNQQNFDATNCNKWQHEVAMSNIYRVLLATAKQSVTKTCQAARHASEMCGGNIGWLSVNVNQEKWFLVSREEIHTHMRE